MAAKEETHHSWSSGTEHFFKADEKHLFIDDFEKVFYDGYETYYIIDNKYPQENNKDKFVLEKDGNFRQYFSSSIELTNTILQGHLLLEAKGLYLKTLQIVCSSETYPLYQFLAMLIDRVKSSSEEEDDCEGFTLVLYKNGMAINLYGWDEVDPYWSDRKANIFIDNEAAEKPKKESTEQQNVKPAPPPPVKD